MSVTRDLEYGILNENRPLELLKLRPRVQAELLPEQTMRPSIDLEALCLSP